MHKIENYLLINQSNSTVTFNEATKQFLKESSLLITNIYATYIQNPETLKIFPCASELYDASWYKNLVVAAQIIEDHVYSKIENNVDYLELLKSAQYVSFVNFAKKWNLINLIVSYELPANDWNELCERYGIFTCSQKLEELIEYQINFNMTDLNQVSMNPNDYRIYSDAESETTYTAETTVQEIENVKPVVPAEILAIAAANTETVKPVEPTDNKIHDFIGIDNLESRIVNELTGSHIKDLDLVMNWFKANDNDLKNYKMKKHITDRDIESKNLSRLTAKIMSEYVTNKQLISAVYNKLPVNPGIEECNELLQWIDNRITTINTHRSIMKNSTPAKEAVLIARELELARANLYEMEAKIKVIRDNKPLHPGVQYLDDIINWVDHKEANPPVMMETPLTPSGETTI